MGDYERLVLNSQHFFFNAGAEEYTPNHETVEGCIQRDGVQVVVPVSRLDELVEPVKDTRVTPFSPGQV